MYDKTRIVGRKKAILFFGNWEEDQSNWTPLASIIVRELVKSCGVDAIIIQEALVPDYEAVIREHADDLLFFGVTATTPQIPASIEAIRRLRRHAPDVPVIWGGCHASVAPYQTIDSEFADFVCIGKAKDNVVRLVSALMAGEDANAIPNILTKDNRATLSQGGGKYNYEADVLYYPDIRWQDYDFTPLISENRVLNYMASFGCPGQCSFCTWGQNHNWQPASVERTLADVEYLVRRYDLRNVWFNDATMTANKKFFLQVAEGLLERNLDISWRCFSRAPELNKFDRAELKMLERAGLEHVYIGIETMDAATQKLIHKRNRDEEIEGFLAKMLGIDIRPHLSFLFGLPGMTVAQLELDRTYVERWRAINPAVSYQINFFIPFPGSNVFELACEGGFPFPEGLEECGLFYRDLSYSSDKAALHWFSPEERIAYLRRFCELFPEEREVLASIKWPTEGPKARVAVS